jgi:hypothetical protein
MDIRGIPIHNDQEGQAAAERWTTQLKDLAYIIVFGSEAATGDSEKSGGN